MQSTSEVGHAKNIANLQKLTEQVAVYPLYNPPVQNLTVGSLLKLYTTASLKVNEVEDKRNEHKNAVTSRKTIFQNLKPTATKIINHISILALQQGTLAQAKSLNQSIQGYQKKQTESTEEGKPTPKKISTSRQSYTQQTENFGILIQLLETIPAYSPNEEDLRSENLRAYQKKLLVATQTIDHAEAELNQKLIERNQILYTKDTGLYDIAQNVKKYVKSLYGATSPEYTHVSSIEFTTRK